MKTAFLAWQDQLTRTWWTVGRLTQADDGVFQFVYTKGAEKSPNFVPFSVFSDKYTTYESKTLFPLFANRLLPQRRPEYDDFVRWLNVPESEHDPITLLVRSGGLRATDTLEMFPCPERVGDDTYCVRFFVRGIRHLPQPHAADRVNSLKPGEKLFLMHDFQNPHDKLALAIRTDQPPSIVGYCPRYLANDAGLLAKGGVAEVRVEKVNPDAPSQLRLLCNLTAAWPVGFQPCRSDEYEPLVDPSRGTVVDSSGPQLVISSETALAQFSPNP